MPFSAQQSPGKNHVGLNVLYKTTTDDYCINMYCKVLNCDASLWQTHQAVGSANEVLERTSGKAFPSKKRILQAYLSFEAPSDHTYTFSCVTCGYYPVSVVMDLHKKGVFRMPGKSTRLFIYLFYIFFFFTPILFHAQSMSSLGKNCVW